MNWSRFVTLVLVLYWTALAVGTHVPELPAVSVRHGDKMAHYVAYAGLAFLLSWAWTTRRAYFPRGAVFALAVAVLYGAIDELTQMLVPGRSSEWNDWWADTLGAVTGIVLFSGVIVIRRRLLARSVAGGP